MDANDNFDLIYIVTHGAIKNWDHEAAIDFVKSKIKVPVFICEDFMMPYAVFGMTKVASEHGIWAAKISNKILKGEKPIVFPVTHNQLFKGWLNLDLAQKNGFYPDSLLLSTLKILEK